jgi:dihydrofolate reductase
MAMPMDAAFDEHNAERMRAAGTVLLGATTYRTFLGFWPAALGDEGMTPGSREIAERWASDLPRVVVSDRMTAEDTGPWRRTTRIVRRAETHAAVAELRAGEGGDVLVFGSRTLWNDLLRAGLVDELHLMVGPRLVAGAAPLLTGLGVRRDLRLLGVRRWPGSDNVVLSYALDATG